MKILNKIINSEWYCRMFHTAYGANNNKWHCPKCDRLYDRRPSNICIGPK